jgi:cytochrome c
MLKHLKWLFLVLIALMLALWYFAGNTSQIKSDGPTNRPNDPWVFRSVLDKQPRMITMALDHELWVAYSTDRCALYKAWKGGVNFDGTVWNMRHGPQPTTRGNAWFENEIDRPWLIESAGKLDTATTEYKGHRFTEDGHTQIFYDLVGQNGVRIRVNEQPEFVQHEGQKGFERQFTLSEVPSGVNVKFCTNVNSIADRSNLVTDGKWTDGMTKKERAGNLYTTKMNGVLTLNTTAPTTLTTWFVSVPVVENAMESLLDETANLSPGERLMDKSDCRTCHNAEMKTVGPAYTAIAEKYKNNPSQIQMLANKVIKGGSGVWGVAAMSAHPELSLSDAKSMVSYILSLDEGKDDGEGGGASTSAASTVITGANWLSPVPESESKTLSNALIVKVFDIPKTVSKIADINWTATPTFTGLLPQINFEDGNFGPFTDHFAVEAEGFLHLEKDDNALIELACDDGGILWIDDQVVIDHDGLHGAFPKEAEVALRKGYHKFKIRYFQGGGGRAITVKWARTQQAEMAPITFNHFFHGQIPLDDSLEIFGNSAKVPGDGSALLDVHPSFTLTQARPNDFLPKVAGMDFLSDGRLVVSTWDPTGGVYILSNVASGDPARIKVKRIASGLAEPLGVKVVNDTIYVLQKQELTRLVDLNGDDVIDEYQCFAKGWRASANFHEFAFGLAYKEGFFYATLAIAIMPGGASARPQIPDRGKVLKINAVTGEIEYIARGLRTPNGIGLGVDNEIFVADNQGDWLPSSKILHVTPGAFFNSYAVDSAVVAQMPIKQPVVWLPQDEIGNSPSTPLAINVGPYAGQMIHGEVTHGGVKRVFVEKIDGEYQGCVFRFIQGLESGVNRMAWGPDGALYIGGIGNPGNWGHTGKLWYGLQRLAYNGKSTFEMLAVRAKTNGVEIEFTEPLKKGDGQNLANYTIKQWYYKPTTEYGGPKLGETTLAIKTVNISDDRKKVFLELEGIKAGHVVYVHLNEFFISDIGNELRSTEAWYTMNRIPQNTYGVKTNIVAMAATPDNQLSENEKAEGWKLLFNGQNFDGWRNFKQETVIGTDWVVDQGSIHLAAKKNAEGHWQSGKGGDIITDLAYENFELSVEWKINACGNSGIIYFVQESDKYDYVWQTGPEMQLLDNTCHPDSQFPKHRAGDLYDLQECKYVNVKPAGQWNKARLVSKNGKVEHWLNNRCLVTYDFDSQEFRKMIAGSKFAQMPGFAKVRKGHISLQDHGDPVWYRNLKIRAL